jgi:DNA-binding transcriptional MerR regulator
MEEKTLKEVCELAGVTRRAVQGYEKAGLVAAAGRNKYGHLLYDEVAIKRISEIKQYQDFGFKVKEIQVLMTAPKDKYLKLMEKRMAAMQLDLQRLKINIETMKRMIGSK